jgi:hypothetical protein
MRVSTKVQKNRDKKHIIKTEIDYELAEKICILHLESIKEDLEHYIKGKVLVFSDEYATDKKMLKKKIDEVNGIIDYLTK